MAGRDFTGTSRGEYDPGNARAFCEGMTARVAEAEPINPYTSPDLGEEIAWDAGAAVADAQSGSAMTKAQVLNCAIDLAAVVP